MGRHATKGRRITCRRVFTIRRIATTSRVRIYGGVMPGSAKGTTRRGSSWVSGRHFLAIPTRVVGKANSGIFGSHHRHEGTNGNRRSGGRDTPWLSRERVCGSIQGDGGGRDQSLVKLSAMYGTHKGGGRSQGGHRRNVGHNGPRHFSHRHGLVERMTTRGFGNHSARKRDGGYLVRNNYHRVARANLGHPSPVEGRMGNGTKNATVRRGTITYRGGSRPGGPRRRRFYRLLCTTLCTRPTSDGSRRCNRHRRSTRFRQTTGGKPRCNACDFFKDTTRHTISGLPRVYRRPSKGDNMVRRGGVATGSTRPSVGVPRTSLQFRLLVTRRHTLTTTTSCHRLRHRSKGPRGRWGYRMGRRGGDTTMLANGVERLPRVPSTSNAAYTSRGGSRTKLGAISLSRGPVLQWC